MPERTTPLDFEKIDAERSQKIKDLQLFPPSTVLAGDAAQDNTFSTLGVKKPDPYANFTAIPPTGMNQVGVPAPPSADAASPEHFGGGALKVLGDIRQGTVKDIPALLRPLAFPFYKAGQGVLAGLEWSGNVATTAMPHAVEQVQRYIPGYQISRG